MDRSLIANVRAGCVCKISGYVENIRNKSTMAFIVVHDHSGKLQVTVEKATHESLVDTINSITLHSFISVTGSVIENAFVKLGGRELIASEIKIESIAAPLPLLKDSNIDTRLDYRWIDLRDEKNDLIFRVQTCIAQSFRAFLLERDFMELHTPKLIGAASESGADVFELKYFDRKAYLSQSPQFYKQMAMAAGFDRIFEFGPVFRAEKSYTSKHTTEFTGFDLEFSYIESYRDIMELEEQLIAYTLCKVKEKYADQIMTLYSREVVVPLLPFPKMKLADVYDELEKRYQFTALDSEKGDLSTEAEKLCSRLSMDMFGHEFLFVTDYSRENRAFYHMRKDGVPEGYDLIWKGVEITTGAQREHRYDVLAKQAAEKGLGEDIKFYLEFFRYGCPPHGGFGLGLDRITMMLFGIGIKEVMFVFRGPTRLTP